MITIKVKNLISQKDRTIGLINYSKPEPVMFLTRFGIHTFGLVFPIDVVILDKDGKAVKLTRNLKPNNVLFWPIRYNKVLELPAGLIKKYKIKIGSKIATIESGVSP